MDASCTGPWLWSSAWFSLLGLFGHTAFSNRPAKQSENGECQECYEIFLTAWQTPRWQTQHLTVVRHAPEARKLCTVYTTDQGKGTVAPLFAHICTRHRILILFDTFWFFWMWRVSVCADRLCWPHAAGHADCRMWQLPNSTVSGLGFWSWCGCSFVQHHTFLLSISCFAALVRYVSAHGRIFICCGCHCANRIPLEVGRTEVSCRCFQHTISTVVQKDEKLPVI